MTTYLTSINNQAEAIEKTLIDLGYQLSDRGKYWQCNAVYRDGDNRTALQIWKDTGIWKDFVANTSYQPFKRLLELTCKDDSKIEEILNSIKNNNDPCIESTRTPKMESDQFLDHSEIKTLLPHYDFYNKKGISSKTLELYQSGFSMSGKMNGRFVFPIFDDNKKIIGITCSTFDLLHAGHIIMLEECKKYCDYLICALQVDPSLDRPEKNKPVQSLVERYIQLDAVSHVDKIIPYTNEEELNTIFASLDLDVRILGEEYKDKKFTAKDICQKRGIKLVYNKRDHDFSTSSLRERIYNQESNKRFSK